MKIKVLYILFFGFTILFSTSCGSSRRIQTSKEVTSTRTLSNQLGVPVTSKDNIRLYSEAANWLGTPYRHGGQTKKGVDCSGLASYIYKEVYRKPIARSTADILKKDCRKINKSKLQEGDLVFFNTTGKNKKTPTHVGVYLKDGKFVHASSSRGVIVSSLSEPYYARNWLTGGRVQ